MLPVRNVVLLEDDPSDAAIVRRTLGTLYPHATIERVDSREQFLSRLDAGSIDIVVSDSTVIGCEGLKAFHLARERHPRIPFVYLSGAPYRSEKDVLGLRSLGVSAFLTKDDLSKLGPAIDQALVERERDRQSLGLLGGFERLIGVITELSLARALEAVMAVVRRAARDLTGADGATFVLREGTLCHYADEDAIAPLWKGRRFPMSSCLSGWAMVNRQPAVVPDIYRDSRIPLSVYEPTFVRSVVMVPIRAMDPIGAIGAYWSEAREPHPQEVRLLQALADTTAVALANVQAFSRLEERVQERTADLDAFVGAISHDLRAPVRHVRAFADMLLDDRAETLDPEARRKLGRISSAAGRMRAMIDGLLELSRTAQTPVGRQPVDLASLAQELAEECQTGLGTPVDFTCPATLPAEGDAVLLRNVLQNLLSNAWKFTARSERPRVELGVQPGSPDVYFVRDNGAGFDDRRARRLFEVFQRLHDESEFPGAGVGLAITQRVVRKHGGKIWAESRPGEGATFFFTLAPPSAPDQITVP